MGSENERETSLTPAATDRKLASRLRERHNCIVDISVVVPTINEAENLPLLLPQIRRTFESLGVTGEVIVVDGGSTDDTVSAAETGGARVVSEAGTGFAAAITRGIAEARGTFVVTMDGDNSHEA